MDAWRNFWEQNEGIVSFINSTSEGFWARLGDLITRINEERYTTRGAVVREYPRTQESATQVETRKRRDIGVQTEAMGEPEPKKRSREPHASLSETDEEPEVVFVRTTAPGVAKGCWNCQREGHKYTACPRLERATFCYGCGQKGVTIKLCPRCGPHYYEKGPFRGFRGPRDRSPPQGRWGSRIEIPAWEKDRMRLGRRY